MMEASRNKQVAQEKGADKLYGGAQTKMERNIVRGTSIVQQLALDLVQVACAQQVNCTKYFIK